MQGKPLSKSERRALEVIKSCGEVYPRRFAKGMWPDSPCWNHHTKAGPHGVMKAGGMNLAAGGYLAKLCRRGLVSWRSNSTGQSFYSVSAAGEKALEEALAQKG